MQCNNIKEIQISFEALKKGVAKFSSLLLQSQPLFDRLSSNVSETSGSQILLIQSERNLSSTIQPSGNFEGRLFQQSGDILLGSPQSSGNSAQALSQPLQNMIPPKPPTIYGTTTAPTKHGTATATTKYGTATASTKYGIATAITKYGTIANTNCCTWTFPGFCSRTVTVTK